MFHPWCRTFASKPRMRKVLLPGSAGRPYTGSPAVRATDIRYRSAFLEHVFSTMWDPDLSKLPRWSGLTVLRRHRSRHLRHQALLDLIAHRPRLVRPPHRMPHRLRSTRTTLSSPSFVVGRNNRLDSRCHWNSLGPRRRLEVLLEKVSRALLVDRHLDRWPQPLPLAPGCPRDGRWVAG